MGYTEKDGRLFDTLTGQDMGPAKARLDPKGLEIPETQIIQHTKGGCFPGPGIPLRNPEIEKNGQRTSLVAKPAFLPDNLPSEAQDPRIAYSEAQELNACRKAAGPWVLSLLDVQIRLFQLALEDQECGGFAFQAKQSKIYLDALKTAREGAKKALDAGSETLLHTCRSSNDPACFACAVHRPIGDFLEDDK